MGEKEQVIAMDRIVHRLVSSGKYDEETLSTIIEGLREEERWPTYKIIAYLDMIDLEDRT